MMACYQQIKMKGGLFGMILAIGMASASSLFSPVGVLKLALQNLTKHEDHRLQGNMCSAAFYEIMSNDAFADEQFRIYLTSGKSVNDLGLYGYCIQQPKLKYALVVVQTKDTEPINQRREVMFGLCVPRECETPSDMMFLDNFYQQLLIESGVITVPDNPQYTFPQDLETAIWSQASFQFIICVGILTAIILMAIVSYFIENGSLGDKHGLSNLVEAIDEDNPERVSIDSRKKKWAQFVYSFSMSRNFQEIFTRSYKSIKDRRFDVFDGLRVQMLAWIILGHCYLLGNELGQNTRLLKKKALDNFFAQIIVSADFPISFLYFMSGFIGMYALIKKFQQSNENAQNYQRINESTNSDQTCQSMNIPRLSKTSLGRQVLSRWLRLAFPTYILISVAIGIFPYFTQGPTFMYYSTKFFQVEIRQNWWAYLLFISNVYPPFDDQGLYWLFFVANELQFYIFVMMPAIYFYQKRHRRNTVLFILSALIIESILYLSLITLYKGFSTLLVLEEQSMYDDVFRYPFGPVGYYAFGVMLAIFYFEFQQSISNRELRRRKTYRFMRYIGAYKKRQLICQLIGSAIILFVIFIRFSSFGNVDNSGYSPQAADMGRWPLWLNAIFNGLAHYFFIIGFILLFLPVFIGKLSLVRDIYAAQFFRPFSRTSFTLACFQGLGMQLVFYSQQQPIFFEHKNMLFLYCGIMINGYIITLVLSLLFEWPFRTMARVVFSAPQRVMLRLKGDLAKELNTNFIDDDNMISDSNEEQIDLDESSQETAKRFSSGINDDPIEVKKTNLYKAQASARSKYNKRRLTAIEEEDQETEQRELSYSIKSQGKKTD